MRRQIKSTQSKHLKGRLRTRVGNVTFLDQWRSVGTPCWSRDVFGSKEVGWIGFSRWFHGFSWFLVGFHGFFKIFSLFFMVFGWFPWFFQSSCMVFGWFPWFFKVVSWFFMVFGWFPWFFHGSRLVFHVQLQ